MNMGVDKYLLQEEVHYMNNIDGNEYEQSILELRRRKQLHSIVEKRLTYLLRRVIPEEALVPEIYGVPGGRHDLMAFSFNGKRIVFELFFSPSQVSQDLRLLERSTAEKKIAILLDHEVDPKLSNEYFRKKPDSFPFIWLKWVMKPDFEKICIQRLREIIDEKAVINQLRYLLESPVGENLERHLREQFDEINKIIGAKRKSTELLEDLTPAKLASLRVINEFRKKGIPLEKLRSLYAWLLKATPHAFMIVGSGFQAFLITDLEGRHAIWSDGDLADDLILSPDVSKQPNVVLCLNDIINDILEEVGSERQEIQWHFFHSYLEFIKKIVPRSDITNINVEEQCKN